jgi:4-amino-4-deoxy-L-arabinose transferase-like glycosyltransferase
MAVNVAREGYELWRPNREKPEAKTMRFVVAIVLLISAGLLALIVLGGWKRLESHSVGVITLLWAGLYVLFAILVVRWNRGVLPVAAALAIIMAIFAAIAAPGWFDRDKAGLSGPALDDDLLGLLCLVMIPTQLLLIAVAMVGFNQEWHVEEERPVGGYEPGGVDYAYEEPAANRPELSEPAEYDETEPDAQPPEVREDEEARRPPERADE